MSTDILRGASFDSMTVTLWLRRLYTFKPRTNHDNTYVEEVETQLNQNVIFEIMTEGIQSQNCQNKESEDMKRKKGRVQGRSFSSAASSHYSPLPPPTKDIHIGLQ